MKAKTPGDGVIFPTCASGDRVRRSQYPCCYPGQLEVTDKTDSMKETEMKTQPTMTERGSFHCRFFLLLVLAAFSPATLVCAQTPKNRETEVKSESISTLMIAVKEQREQIRQQQQEIDNLKKLNAPGTPGENGNDPGTIVGTGTPVKHIISVSKSIAFNSPNDSWVDVAVPGAQLTDLVLIGVPYVSGKRFYTGYVDKPDNVRVRVFTSVPAPNLPTQPIVYRIVVIGF